MDASETFPLEYPLRTSRQCHQFNSVCLYCFYRVLLNFYWLCCFLLSLFFFFFFFIPLLDSDGKTLLKSWLPGTVGRKDDGSVGQRWEDKDHLDSSLLIQFSPSLIALERYCCLWTLWLVYRNFIIHSNHYWVFMLHQRMLYLELIGSFGRLAKVVKKMSYSLNPAIRKSPVVA